MRVGIPRGLLYYEYSPLWTNFFQKLGVDVLTSHKSNKRIINNGTFHTVDDACIPVKLYHGHVLDLKDKVDYLFIPRIMGVYPKEYICPKFCGLPEMINCSIQGLPKVINTKIDLTKKNNEKASVLEIGRHFCSNKKLILEAYEHAKTIYKSYKDDFLMGILPEENLTIKATQPFIKDKKIMVMGHPYILYDDYLNMNIINKIRDYGFDILTPDMLSEDTISDYAKSYNQKIFWLFFRKLIGASLYMIEHNLADGVIFISSFGCGIDSVVSELVERKMRKNNVPFMLMVIDEHTGEAGFNTRLEAFIDMINWRNKE